MELALLLVLLGAPPEGTQTSTTAEPELIPPRARTALELERPAAFPDDDPAWVTVRLRVSETGEVVRSELIRSSTPLWTEPSAEPAWDAPARGVLEGVLRFSFEPATYGGTPVPVDIDYTHHFPPRPRPPSPAATSTSAPPAEVPRGPRPDALLAGRVEVRGTRAPVVLATIIALSRGDRLETTTGEAGEFELPLFSGTATISVIAAGNRRFVQREHLAAGERLEVAYLVERERYDPYEVVVVGRKERTEVARTTLRGRDLTQVPGTFGDPFRVIGALPGVSSMMSLLPFPIVRGSSPGNTGFLIDGVRVPLLFHLLAGPSVIHPELMDAIEFSPGGFPAEYGGYTGGIVDGKTRAAGPDERRIEVDLNLLQAGALLRRPLPFGGMTATLAARYGFPGLMISLASPRTSLDYWDYQARIDGAGGTSRFTLFLFGANDALDAVPAGLPDDAPREPLLHFQFHRADLRLVDRAGDLTSDHQLTLGYDRSLSPDATLESLTAVPRIRWSYAPERALTLRFGLDASAKRAELTAGEAGTGELGLLLGAGGDPASTLLQGGLLAELIWSPREDVVLRPGIRTDAYADTNTTHGAVDPRLLARWRVHAAEPELWLKGSAGLYHQPPRFTIPLPGLDEIAFEKGLLESAQVMLGLDASLGGSWSVDVQTYFNWMDPILYDTQLNPTVDDLETSPPAAPPGQAPATPPRDTGGLDDRLDRLLAPATGRSYGVELLVRRESRSGVSGWIAYTFSRSERLRDGEWVAFDFDRTHILNLVAGVPLPRDWQLGLRAQLQSGRPLTTTTGLSSARTAPFVRFDLRVDKTAVWNDWLLDFYVDIANVVLGAEELTAANEVRYVLPTLGLRAIF